MATEGHKTLLRKLSRDLILMGRVLVPDMFTLPTPDFHHEITRLLQAVDIKKLNIIAPRGHAKSSIVGCLFPIWHIWFRDLFLAEERSSKFVVLVSKTQAEAIRRLRTIKNVIESPPFRKLFGDWTEETAKVWTKAEVILKDGTVITATGTGQQARGLKEGHQRPTLIVLDDPEDEENTKTIERMEQNLEWLLQALDPALSDDGRLVVIGTPQHQRSMVMVLKDSPEWITKHYKALNERTDEDGNQVVEALWPEKKSVEDLHEKRQSFKAIGRVHVFYREYQCQITQGEDSPFRPEHFSYWDGYVTVKDEGPFTRHYLHVTHRGRGDNNEPIPLDEKEVHACTVTMGIDPAASTRKGADYSVIVPVAHLANGDKYVLPYFRERVDPIEHARQIYRFYERHQPLQTRIEQDGYQRMLKQYLMHNTDRFPRRIPGLEADTQTAKVRKNSQESKEEWHLGYQYLFAEGHVHIQPGMQAFFEEWTLFPDTSHDDLRDGFCYAIVCERPPNHAAEDRHNDEPSTRHDSPDPMLA